jgi:phytoene dehydrogenase-like protein
VLSSIAFVEEAFGAWHIKGGVGKLADAVYQRCLDRGVKFEFNSPVAAINHNGKSVTGLSLGAGRSIDYQIVVANADASLVYGKLISGKVSKLKRTRKNLDKAEPSLAGFSLLLGLRPTDQPTGLSHHNVLFPKDYDEAMVKHPGHEAWFVLVNAPRHEESGSDGFDWNDRDANHRYAMKIIDAIEARGISVRDRLEVLEIRTPADLERTVMAPGGSIYGTSSNGARSAFLRAKNRSPLKGLYCVGGSAHPGGGLPLVGLSAEIVAQAVVGPAAH